MSRLVAFLVAVTRKDGSKFDCVFYALDRREALRIARAWSARMGHVQVALVLDEEKAA